MRCDHGGTGSIRRSVRSVPGRLHRRGEGREPALRHSPVRPREPVGHAVARREQHLAEQRVGLPADPLGDPDVRCGEQGRHLDALEVLELEGVGDLLSAGAERDLLTPDRVRLTLDQLLRRNPFLVEAESISQIGHLLGGGRPEGQLAPLRIGRLLDR